MIYRPEVKKEVIENLQTSLQKLVNELYEKNLLNKCTAHEKQKIGSIINELKYSATRVKNTFAT